MATGFLILTLYGLCAFLIVALVSIGGGLYFLGRREERKERAAASERVETGPAVEE